MSSGKVFVGGREAMTGVTEMISAGLKRFYEAADLL